MFTGIVEEIGVARRVTNSRLVVGASKVLAPLALGDSIAVNGVCLTVDEQGGDWFAVGVMAETLRRTNLGQLRAGNEVNLERALSFGRRLGGHFVQGHIDGTGRLAALRPEGGALIVRIETPPEVLRYVVEKGFIAVDGVSLTVVSVGGRDFTISLVGFTQQNIILPRQRPGQLVNLEVDILGKYVERFVSAGKRPDGITEEFLVEQGFI